jgi:hypothetical protein
MQIPFNLGTRRHVSVGLHDDGQKFVLWARVVGEFFFFI